MSVTNVGFSPGLTPVSPTAFHEQKQPIRLPLMQTERKVKPHISSTAADLEKISLAFNRKLQFVVDHNSNQVIIKVIDKETDKVIKELPPEELQRLHSHLKEAIGLLFNEMV